MEPIRCQFPRALRDAIANPHAPGTDPVHEALAVAEVRQAFVRWANENAAIVSHQPLLGRIVREIASREGNVLSRCLGRVGWLVPGLQSTDPCQRLLEELRSGHLGSRELIDSQFRTFQNGVDWSASMATLMTYHDAGLLSSEILLQYLLIRDKNGDAIIHYAFIQCDPPLALLGPLLRKICTYAELVSLFQTRDGRGEAPLYAPRRLPDILPLLRETCTPAELISLFQTKTGAELVSLFRARDSAGDAPVHISATLRIILPLLREKCTGAELVSLFQTKNINGYTPLHNPPTLHIILSLLREKCTGAELVSLLQIKDKDGYAPVYYDNVLPTILPLLREKCSGTELLTLWHTNIDCYKNARVLSLMLSLLKEKLSNEQFVSLLQISKRMMDAVVLPFLRANYTDAERIALLRTRGNNGETLLHDSELFVRLLDLMRESLPAEAPWKPLYEVLQITDSEGNTVLKKLYFRKGMVKERLTTIPATERDQLLEMPNLQGVSLQSLLRVPPSLTWLTKHKPAADKVRIAPEDYAGKADALTSDVRRLLATISGGNPSYLGGRSFNEVEQGLQAMLQRIRQKEFFADCPREEARLYQAYSEMTANFLIVTRELARQNDPALTATCLAAIAEAELTLPPSFAAYSSALRRAVEGMYPQRIAQLIERVERNFNAASASHPTALGTHSKAGVLSALQHMLGTMRDKTAWLGTPRADQPQELSDFYHEMLENFELLMNQMESNADPEQMVGMLVGIAKARLERRCAAAYQGEIEQARAIVTGTTQAGKSTIDDLVLRATHMALRDCIEQIVRERYRGDVHAYNQFLYALGLARTPDPLTSLSVEDAQAQIVQVWTIDRILERFGHAMSKVPREAMYEFFKARTPDTFDPPEIQLLRRELHTFELAQVNLVKGQLLALGLDEPQLQRLIPLDEPQLQRLTPLFISPRGAALSAPAVSAPPDMSRAIEQLTPEEESRIHAEEDGLALWHLLREKLSMTQAAALPFKAACLRMAAGNQLRNAIAQATGSELPLLDEIVAIKSRFDQAIDDQVRDRGIGFNRSAHGLPSRALDNDRQNAYALQFLRPNGQMNQWGMIDLLLDQELLTVEPI